MRLQSCKSCSTAHDIFIARHGPTPPPVLLGPLGPRCSQGPVRTRPGHRLLGCHTRSDALLELLGVTWPSHNRRRGTALVPSNRPGPARPLRVGTGCRCPFPLRGCLHCPRTAQGFGASRNAIPWRPLEQRGALSGNSREKKKWKQKIGTMTLSRLEIVMILTNNSGSTNAHQDFS